MRKIDWENLTEGLLNKAITLLSIAALIFGTVWLTRTVLFVRGATKVSATITGTEVGKGSKGKAVNFPLFTFTDAAGVVHNKRSEFSVSGYDMNKPGTVVTVLYDPANPEKAEIETFDAIWFGPLVTMGIGLAFTIIVVAEAWAQRRKRLKEQIKAVQPLPIPQK